MNIIMVVGFGSFLDPHGEDEFSTVSSPVYISTKK